MAEAEDEKKSDTSKSVVNDQFQQIRQLLNEREKKLLDEVDKAQSKDIKIAFDTDTADSIKKLISSFGSINIEEKSSTDSTTIALESSIITDKDELAKLANVLKQKLLENKKLTLLYRSTRDDDTKEEFHTKCDNKGATLTIVHTEFDAIFCCFTCIPWTSIKSQYNSDDNAFIFSLRSCFEHDTPKIYIIENDKYKPKAVYHNLNYGPAFGHGQDIGIDP
eukprot:791022_1